MSNEKATKAGNALFQLGTQRTANQDCNTHQSHLSK